jgi:hypothetical protein
VVAAGNRAEDRALVRALSSALVNRVLIVNVRVDLKEWLVWARANGVRSEILAFIAFLPEALMRPVPTEPVPFSTPRSWAFLSRALDLAERAGVLDDDARRALAFGRVTAADAAIFCAMAEQAIDELHPLRDYLLREAPLPPSDAARWFVLSRIRGLVQRDELGEIEPAEVNQFLASLPEEHRFALLVDLVEQWGRLGADQVLLQSLREVTGL